MNKWYINITMKNSGIVKPCFYDGVETTSGDVIRKLFQNRQDNEYVSLFTNVPEKKGVLTYVCVGEIAAIDIYKKKG